MIAPKTSLALLVFGSLGSLAAMLGCSSDSTPADTRKTFRDAKGRSCKIAQFTIEAECDVPAAPSPACGAGQRACYLTKLVPEPSDGGAPGPTYVKNCDSCCKEGVTNQGTVSDNCSLYTCTQASDCGGYNANCVDGRCVVR